MMLRTAQQTTPKTVQRQKRSQRSKDYQFGYRSNGPGSFQLEPGADRKYTSIFWGEHMFDENMPNANEKWNNPMPSSVGTMEDFGIEPLSAAARPPGAFEGVNRPWVGHKPSKVTSGHFGSGMAIRDSWGPDMEASREMGLAKPEVMIDSVSVDFFLDEFSVPKNAQNTVMESCNSRHTRNFRINNPKHDNTLDTNTVLTLLEEVRESTMSIGRRITMVGAVQNGKTEWFCKGLPLSHYARQLRWVVSPPEEPSRGFDSDSKGQVEGLAEFLVSKRDVPCETLERSEIAVSGQLHGDEGLALRLLEAASRQASWIKHHQSNAPEHPLSPPEVLNKVCTDVRHSMRLIHALALGDSPTISFVNGKAHNIGAGLAILCNYAALRTEAELTFHGGSAGTTPIGGLLRHLRDPTVDTKYPGLGEYMMLTGDKVCYGDAKRLGWTAVSAPTDIHLNERMLHDYMNMHGQGEHGNASRILHSALFNDMDQSHEMDRCSISATKAGWVRECFHNKASVADIKAALKAVIDNEASLAEHDTAVVVSEKKEEEASLLSKHAWASLCLGLMDRYAPLPQAVSLAMLRKARAEQLDLVKCMELEYRCFVRTITRADFIKAQLCTGDLEDVHFPSTPSDWDNKDVGTRPSWSPANDAEVSQAEVEAILNRPLEWLEDGTTELDLSVETLDSGLIHNACQSKGVEVVDSLGERAAVASQDTAYLPQGVNVYRTARHPQSGVVGSHREDTATEAQLAYQKEQHDEASQRLKEGRGRVYNRSGELYEEGEESRTERQVRAARGRWDEARMVAEQHTYPETHAMLAKGVDVGGEVVLSPEGRYRHSAPFTPPRETTYGDIPEHRANITSHYYAPETGLKPKQVRNWGNLERFVASRTAAGAAHHEIAQAVLGSDL